MHLQPKKIKKEISFLWKDIAQKIEAGVMPDKYECQDLIKKANDYAIFAGKEWSDQWMIFCKDLSDMIDKAQGSQLQEADSLRKKIKQQKKTCHKQFKK
jgi:XXXCH domain-containing protein